jgi:hypothetical protein
MFKVIAPKGQHTAYRQIVSCDGVPVLSISTGEYLPRLGNLRESAVYLIENGKETDCIICEYGGVVRDLLNFMNNKPSNLEAHFSLEAGAWEKLRAIKSAPNANR